MRIAYISYEHPLGVAGGGIGTYLGQIAKVMTDRGHLVEVFTGHPGASGTITYENYIIHRVQAKSVSEFRERVMGPFKMQQAIQPFEIIESGEYGADALFVKKAFPHIPLTIKLHTPTFLISRLNNRHFGALQKSLFLLKCLRKGIFQRPFWMYDKHADIEYELFQLADTVSSPSNSLKTIINREWDSNKKIAVVPLPFTPSEALLNISPVTRNPGRTVICFVGKLEVRKGVIILMKAIPEVVRQSGNVMFRFIGEPLPSPVKGLNMQEYILRKLQPYSINIEFTGKQPAAKIPNLIADCQICVFPSLWENFPNVSLEAMAAGKVVIGTNNGGMADMITHEKNGILIPPQSRRKLAKAICDAMNGGYDMENIGREARQRILSGYNREYIGQVTEDFYKETIDKKSKSMLPITA
jgi:glycosyltransferase involved in cell wall biosynthesis